VNTQILQVSSQSPEASKVKKAADLLKKGRVVAIPTETVYGLAVNADDKKAIDALYSVKNRSKDKPFTIQISDLARLNDYSDALPGELSIILHECWPGPLTIIISGRKGKVGLRMPDNKVALSIIEATGLPLAVTSANISDEPPALSSAEVLKAFDGKIDMVVDDKKIPSGIESTVLDCTGPCFKIIRKGPFAEKIRKFLNIYG